MGPSSYTTTLRTRLRSVTVRRDGAYLVRRPPTTAQNVTRLTDVDEHARSPTTRNGGPRWTEDNGRRRCPVPHDAGATARVVMDDEVMARRKPRETLRP